MKIRTGAFVALGLVTFAYLTPSFFLKDKDHKQKHAEELVREVLGEDLVGSDMDDFNEYSELETFEGEERAQGRSPSSVQESSELFLKTGGLNPEAFAIEDHFKEISTALSNGWIEESEVEEYKVYLEFIQKHDEEEMMEVYGEYGFEDGNDHGGNQYDN